MSLGCGRLAGRLSGHRDPVRDGVTTGHFCAGSADVSAQGKSCVYHVLGHPIQEGGDEPRVPRSSPSSALTEGRCSAGGGKGAGAGAGSSVGLQAGQRAERPLGTLCCPAWVDLVTLGQVAWAFSCQGDFREKGVAFLAAQGSVLVGTLL